MTAVRELSGRYGVSFPVCCSERQLSECALRYSLEILSDDD